MPCRQSTVCGTSSILYANFCVSRSPLLQMRMGRPYKHETHTTRVTRGWQLLPPSVRQTIDRSAAGRDRGRPSDDRQTRWRHECVGQPSVAGVRVSAWVVRTTVFIRFNRFEMSDLVSFRLLPQSFNNYYDFYNTRIFRDQRLIPTTRISDGDGISNKWFLLGKFQMILKALFTQTMTHTRPRPLEIADRRDMMWHPPNADTQLLTPGCCWHWHSRHSSGRSTLNMCMPCVRVHQRTRQDEMLTSQFRSSAICKDNSCSGMMVRMPCRQSTVVGTSRVLDTCDLVSSSPVLHITKGLPYKHNQSMQPMRGDARRVMVSTHAAGRWRQRRRRRCKRDLVNNIIAACPVWKKTGV